MWLYLTKRGDAQFCLYRGNVICWLVVCWLCFFQSNIGYAVDVQAHFKSLSVADGLSQSTVFGITQDQEGFLWFATQDGLNRYDGYNFKTYYPTNNDSGLVSSNIRTLMLAKDGQLWVGTEKSGISVFSPVTERFVSYTKEDGRSQLSSNEILSIFQDSKGHIWVGTVAQGLQLFNAKTQQFTQYLAGFDIRDIIEDSHGVLWLATNQGLVQFEPDNQQWLQYRPQYNDDTSISHLLVTTLELAQEKYLWVGTQHGLNLMDLTKPGVFRRFYADIEHGSTITHNNITDLLFDSNNRLWISSFGGGVNRMDEHYQVVHYGHSLNQGNSLTDDVALTLFEDSQGSLWVGTWSAGVNQLSAQQQVFDHIQYQEGVEGTLSNNVVRSIFKDSKQRLWIGTHDGINVIDEGKVSGKGFELLKIETEASIDAISDRHLISIVEDSQGDLWFGTPDGVDRYSPDSGEIVQYFHQEDDPYSLSDNYVRQLLYDSKGNLWLATNQGMNRYDAVNDRFERFVHDEQDENSLSGNSVRALFEDDKGDIWVGTRAGLNRFDVKNQKFKRYRSGSEPGSLSHDFVTSIYQDVEGQLWLTTYGGGLNLYDYVTDSFTHYTKAQGLSNNSLYSVLEDDLGHLWLSSNSGLSRFNPRTERFRHYRVKDGLQSDEFNYGAHFKAADGEIFFGGINGFNRFYPDNSKDDTKAPDVALTDFLLGNQILPVGRNVNNEEFVLSKAINYLDSIQLTYRQNFISFDFTALHFTDPMNNQFAYKLEGQDKDWVMTDALHRRATYTNLANGEYIFRVKASNHNGYWQERKRQLKVIVLPPPWQTWWAYLIYFLLLGMPLLVYLHSQRRMLLYNMALNERLERKVKERTKALEIKNKKIIETQQQLVQSEKMASLGTLTAGVAHEVNNPNNFVSLSTDMLSKEIDGVKDYIFELAGQDTEQEILDSFEKRFEALYYHLNTIKDGSERIKTIVEGLRTFTQLDSAACKTVAVTDLIQSTVDLVKAQYKKIIEFNLDYTIKPEIECYPASLNQVFMNIIVNACHAIENAPRVVVEQQSDAEVFIGCISIDCQFANDEEQQKVKISITDTGHGMTEETKTKLFEPFYTTKPVGEGTGLGLSISYGIIQQHQGELAVESEIDKGSTFILTIPVKMS